MNGKRIVWASIIGLSVLAGFQWIRDGKDPLPQLAGTGAAGFLLLMLAEAGDGAERIAGAFAVLAALTAGTVTVGQGGAIRLPDSPGVMGEGSRATATGRARR